MGFLLTVIAGIWLVTKFCRLMPVYILEWIWPGNMIAIVMGHLVSVVSLILGIFLQKN